MSGYKPRRPAPPPPNMPSHTQLKTYFDRVDANKSGSITPKELQAALVNGNNTEFNITTINMMISKFLWCCTSSPNNHHLPRHVWPRQDRRDHLQWVRVSVEIRHRLAELLQDIWQVRIEIGHKYLDDKLCDRDKSGSINHQELESALTTFGYNLSPPVYTLLLRWEWDLSISLPPHTFVLQEVWPDQGEHSGLFWWLHPVLSGPTCKNNHKNC